MTKIGLISGDGKLPLHIGQALTKRNYEVTYLLLNSVKNKKKYKKEKYVNIEILSMKNILNILNQLHIKNLIFAGSIKRPSIKDVGFDFETIKLAKNLFLEKKGDNNLLIALKKYFENKGFSFLNWKSYCPEIFSTEKYLSAFKPSKIAIQNLNKGKIIYKYYKNTDVGQSMVVQNQMILGLEAIEGTDNLLKRCFEYKRKGDKGILLKFTKKDQSNLIDIPLIGLDTIKNIKKYNYEGIFLEQNKCIILDKEQVIDYARKNKIFVTSVDLN